VALIDSVKSAEMEEVRDGSGDCEATEVGAFRADPEAVTQWEGVSVESLEPEEGSEFDAIIEAVGLLEEVSDGGSELIGTLDSVDEKQFRGEAEVLAQTDMDGMIDPEDDDEIEGAMESLATGVMESDDTKDAVNDCDGDKPPVADDENDELSEPINDELIWVEGDGETEGVLDVDIEFPVDDEADGSDDNEALTERCTDADATTDIEVMGVCEADSEAEEFADTLRVDATLVDAPRDALSCSVDQIDGVFTVDADTSDDAERDPMPLPVLERDTEEPADAVTQGEAVVDDDEDKLRFCEGVENAEAEAQLVSSAVADGIEADAIPVADVDGDSAGDADAEAHSDTMGLLVRESASALRDIASEADTLAVVEACDVAVSAVDGVSESVSRDDGRALCENKYGDAVFTPLSEA
jgi:hypothetical protein